MKALKQKSEDGTVNMVTKIVKRKEVQNVLKSNINKQTFISGLFMAFILIGFLEISQAIKVIISYTWQYDLIAGIIMVAVGGAYMAKMLLTKEPQ